MQHEDDALSRILRSLRLSSGLISRGHFTAPWAVHAGESEGAIFHAVVEGACVAKRDADLRGVSLSAGELVLFTRGDAHTVGDGSGARPRAIGTLEPRSHGGLSLVEHGGGGAPAKVLCGRFSLEHSAANLTELLPPVIVIRAHQSRVVEWLQTTLELISFELDHRRQGSDEILARLTDILFVQVMRAYALSQGAASGSWLAAIQDPRIARALVLIHESPEAPWTADQLATQTGMSRSAFYDRFTELVGDTPNHYLTAWRMRVAVELMQQEDPSTAELAERVGYASEDSFARAFKREMGVTPAAWRRQQG